MSILTLFAYLSTEEIQYKIMMPTSLIRSVSSYFNTGDKDTAQLGAVKYKKKKNPKGNNDILTLMRYR
jgi:hypothetical protein